MDLREIGWSDMDWIDMAQDRKLSGVTMKTIMRLV
jgi:hypothetical protein